MTFDIFVQILGFIGIAFNIIAVQFNSHGKIMLFKTIGEFMFILHYVFLNAWSGVVMDIIGVSRNIIFTLNVKKGKSNKFWIIFFATITIVLGLFTIVISWNSMIKGAIWLFGENYLTLTIVGVFCSILSIIAKFLTTVGYAIKNPHTIRKLNFPSSSCWLVYNFVYFSISGVVNEIFVMSSIVIAEIRYRKPKNLNNPNDH